MRSKVSRYSFFLVVLAIFAWGTAVRFVGITEQGMYSGDSHGYTNEAKSWFDGQPKWYGRLFYRPAIYIPYSLAFHAFGYNDYAIKSLNAGVDVASSLLIFFVALVLTRNKWVSLLPFAVYASNSSMHYWARTEFPHAISSHFVLWSLLLFLLAGESTFGVNRRRILLFCSGVGLGLAANAHPELAMFGPVYILLLAFAAIDQRGKRATLKIFLALSTLFTFGFALPYILGILAFGFSTVVEVFSNEYALSSGPEGAYRQDSLKYHEIFKQIFVNGLWFTFGPRAGGYLLALLAGLPILWGIEVWRRKKVDVYAWAPAALLLGYGAMYPLLVGDFPPSNGRLFITLVPLALTAIVYGYLKPFENLPGRWASLPCIGVFSVLLFLNPRALLELPPPYYDNQFIYRGIYDRLEERVDSENRLVLAPMITSYDRIFQHDFYFGYENAKYLFDIVRSSKDNVYEAEMLPTLFAENKITYLFLDRYGIKEHYIKQRWGKNWEERYGYKYTLSEDLAVLKEYLKAEGAIVIDATPWGDIYALHPRVELLFQNSDFEEGNLTNWTVEGEAFDFQPTQGDNLAARYSNPKWEGKYYAGPQGSYYISTLEMYDGGPRTPRGARRKTEVGTGEMRSIPFTLHGNRIDFLMNGGNRPETLYVALEIEGEIVRQATGNGKATLIPKTWDVTEFAGKEGVIVIVDHATERGSGSVYADYFRYIHPPPLPLK